MLWGKAAIIEMPEESGTTSPSPGDTAPGEIPLVNREQPGTVTSLTTEGISQRICGSSGGKMPQISAKKYANCSTEQIPLFRNVNF